MLRIKGEILKKYKRKVLENILGLSAKTLKVDKAKSACQMATFTKELGRTG